MEEVDSSSIRVSGMQFAYDAQSPLFVDFNLKILPGSRCLLVGANGSGKTTLLKILAGKHMVGGRDVVRVLNSSAFHDTNLVCNGDLSYLGGSWSKTIGSAGDVPLQGDFSAEHMIFGVDGVDPVRREKLIELLDIDLQWRMHKVSDGQRRRVQICMGLLHPFQVLLLDEITVDLDVVARLDLLDFFKEECEQGDVPLQGDFSAEHMIFGVDGVDPVRREKLIELLDIDLQWRMHKVSDGQRRRVQICMGLLHPFQVLLLDEITVDLDVVARLDLLDFFKEECEQRGATIVYATHIYDGLETWATDLAYIQDGVLKRTDKLSELGELKNSANLLSVVESWLRSETKHEKKKPINPPQIQKTSPFDSSPFKSSRHMAYYR
ncbi:ABC transporter I family member 21 like [Actinidia chinensis var. chinensis]|uniref:ABC transporter I family member 21 like n=1 Tax=Actinidia chinensis var. chinensis TaxID=1590841 RepID=A0A2R6PP96_ACTCC|nr:ABC transporter I family member 21 like [Actinidia chinensis var. chinensis]